MLTMATTQYRDGRFSGVKPKMARPLINRLKPTSSSSMTAATEVNKTSVGDRFTADSDSDSDGTSTRRHRRRNGSGAGSAVYCQLLMAIITAGTMVTIAVYLAQDSDGAEKLMLRVHGYMDGLDRSQLIPMLSEVHRNITVEWMPFVGRTIGKADTLVSSIVDLVGKIENETLVKVIHEAIVEVHALIKEMNDTLTKGVIQLNVKL